MHVNTSLSLSAVSSNSLSESPSCFQRDRFGNRYSIIVYGRNLELSDRKIKGRVIDEEMDG